MAEKSLLFKVSVVAALVTSSVELLVMVPLRFVVPVSPVYCKVPPLNTMFPAAVPEAFPRAFRVLIPNVPEVSVVMPV